MKTLYIVRHAKSSWEHPHLSDHDRPLLSKGKKRTKLIGQFLAQNKITIDKMVSSSAVRAYETAKIIAKSIGYPINNIQIDPGVYHTDVDSLVNGLYGLSNDIQSVMYFGHNPTFTYFANEWLDEKIDWLPTSAVAGIVFDTENWEDLASAKFETKIFITPSMLKA
jgi:phosphohistidine phosphatase